MSKIQYIYKNFGAKTLAIIETANNIIEEYEAEGLQLTLRQLYYQFVARDLVANKQSEYKRLGTIISDGRLAGLIDWEAIEDRTRNLQSNSHWDNPGQIIKAAAYSFQLDHWEGQPHRVEVWIEKEALVGVIASICEELDVPYFACKGYVSQSEMWSAAQRLRKYEGANQATYIIHLGDHDPSGIDMTRDIHERQTLFNCPIIVERIALNIDQVEQYAPPPNPAKLSDVRAPKYMAKYGGDSWELDALEPRILRSLIKRQVLAHRDDKIYKEVLAKEIEYKDILAKIEQNWRTL